ncbi:MAG: sigma-70 family RNA polymerase sigma factor [Acidobacteriia bacterium]|nr:sigma-70 family RNA polymerase sigma factor [Terriglobia bacterium]
MAVSGQVSLSEPIPMTLRTRRKRAEIRDRRAWLARTAWRVALDRRKGNPEVGLEDAAEAVLRLRAQGAAPDEIAAQEQMQALLARLIASLPEDLRGVLMLSAAEDLTTAEISEALGIPEGSVRTRLMRARELLRGKLSALLEREHGRR